MNKVWIKELAAHLSPLLKRSSSAPSPPHPPRGLTIIVSSSQRPPVINSGVYNINTRSFRSTKAKFFSYSLIEVIKKTQQES